MSFMIIANEDVHICAHPFYYACITKEERRKCI